MQNRISICMTVFLTFSIIGLILYPPVAADDSPRMAITELRGVLKNPDVVILDVRVAKHWNSSGTKIKGAVREDPAQFDTWADRYTDAQTIVLY